MWRAWRNDSLVVDLVLTTIVFVISDALAVRRIWLFGNVGSARAALYPLEAQILASILGFLIAGTAIIGASESMQTLKRENYPTHKKLVRSLTSSMNAALIALVYAFLASFFDTDTASTPTFAVLGVVVFLLVVTRIARTIRRLFQVLSI